jgi:hypothetical protein
VKDIPINFVSRETSDREKDEDTQERCFHESPMSRNRLWLAAIWSSGQWIAWLVDSLVKFADP